MRKKKLESYFNRVMLATEIDELEAIVEEAAFDDGITNGDYSRLCDKARSVMYKMLGM